MSPVLLVARQELLLSVRSRLTQLFAAVFTVLALAVALAGYVLSGGYGFQDFARTSASLVQLVGFLVPLAALLIGVLALAPEVGTAELLYSQPVSRAAVLAGQLAGVFLALGAAQLVGFGVAGLVIFAQTGDTGFGPYALVVLSSLVLTAVFLGLAAWIAAGAVGRKRMRALAVALVVWFVLVLLVDVAVLAAASFLSSYAASRLIIVSVLVNPVGAIRTGTLLAVEGTAAFGPASLALLRFAGGALWTGILLGLSTVVWLVVPPLLGAWRLRRVDL